MKKCDLTRCTGHDREAAFMDQTQGKENGYKKGLFFRMPILVLSARE